MAGYQLYASLTSEDLLVSSMRKLLFFSEIPSGWPEDTLTLAQKIDGLLQ